MRATGLFKGKQYDVELALIQGSDKYLAVPAAYAFKRMEQAANADGIAFKVNTAWRSFTFQTALYTAYQAALSRGEKPSLVAPPGTSFHEIGEAVDLDTGGLGEKSRVWQWLNANAARFGFRGTVKSEPWHWQYIPGLAQFEQDEDDGSGNLVVSVAALLVVGGLLWSLRR